MADPLEKQGDVTLYENRLKTLAEEDVEKRRREAQKKGKFPGATVVRPDEKEVNGASQGFIEAITNIDKELENIERKLENSKKRPFDFPDAHDYLIAKRDELENVLGDPNVPQELRDKFAANTANASNKFEELIVRSDTEVHQERIGRVLNDILSVKNLLTYKGKDGREYGDRPEKLDIIRKELLRQSKKLLEIDKDMLTPMTQERHEADQQVAAIWVDVENRLRAMSVTGQKKKASAAWMPRVPSPPYQARFTNAPIRKMTTITAAVAAASMPSVNVKAKPLPSVPDGIAGKGEDEKLAYMEELLTAFQTEHHRLVDEHNVLISRLTEQVKERKLQALRDSLK